MRRELVHYYGHDYILLFQYNSLSVLEITEGPEGLPFLPVLTPIGRNIFLPLNEDRLQIVDFGDLIYLVDHSKPPCRLIFTKTSVSLEQDLTPV